MARKPRVEFSGAVYHVTARGNQRSTIFTRDKDRAFFLGLLGKLALRLSWRVHAYCLMGNHFHLLIETPAPNLGKGMQVLGTTYAQTFNRRYGKTGHLFQGRYKALIVEKESHLLEVARYIVNNPVAAALAAHPWDWKWSSCLAILGLADAPEWLETGWTLERFHPSDRKKAISRYRQFISAEGGGNPLEDLRFGMVVGSEEFASHIRPLVEESLGKDRWAKTGRARPSLEALLGGVKSRAERNRAMLEAYDAHDYTLREISDYLGMHEGSACRLVKAERENVGMQGLTP